MVANWNTGTRVGLGVGLALAVMGGGAGASYWRAGAARPATPVVRRDVQAAEYAEQARSNLLGMRRVAGTLLLSLDGAEKVPEIRAQWQAQYAREGARLDELTQSATRAETKALVTNMRKELADFDAEFVRVLGLVEDGTIRSPQAAKNVLHAWMQRPRS